MESYSVEAILSASDKGFSSAMRSAENSMEGLDKKSQKTSASIIDIAKGIGVFKLVDTAISTVMGSLDGAIGRFDTLNKYPTVMQALGYSADDVTKSMDKLKSGIDGLPTSLDGIVADTQQLSISLGDLDKGNDTAIALNNAFLASGASADAASRGMEQYRQMLGRGEVDMQSFKSVQETMPIAMDKVAKSFEDRGVTSTNELYDALKAGDITFTEFNDRLIELNEGVGGFADLAQKNSKGIATSFSNLKASVVKGLEGTIRAIDEGLASIGLGGIADVLDSFKYAINDAFSTINEVIPIAIGYIVQFVETAYPAFKKIYDVLEPLAPVLLAIVGYIATYQAVMGTAKKAVELYTAAQKVMNAIMAANPIGLVVAAVIILVGTIMYLWKTNEDFRNAVIKIWEDIKKVISGTWEKVKSAWDKTVDFFKNLWENVSKTTKDVWQGIKDFFPNLWNGITDSVKTIWTEFTDWLGTKIEVIKNFFQPISDKATSIFNALSTHLAAIWSSITTIAENAWIIIKNVILAPVLLVTSLISGGWQEAMNNLAAIWDNIKNAAMEVFTGMLDLISSLTDAVLDYIKFVWDSIINYLKAIWGAIFTLSKTIFTNVVNGIKNAWDNIKRWTSETWDNIKGITKAKWENIKQTTINIVNALIDAAKQAWEDLKQSVRDTIDRVKETFDKLRDINLFEIGKNVIQGFVDGISNMISAVGDAVKNVASNVTDGLKNALGIHSPSRVMRDQVGKYIPLGIVSGIEKEQRTLDKALDSMIDTDLGISMSTDLQNGLNAINNGAYIGKNEIRLSETKKSANIHLNMGGRVFSAFVDDISSVMGSKAELLLEY